MSIMNVLLIGTSFVVYLHFRFSNRNKVESAFNWKSVL